MQKITYFLLLFIIGFSIDAQNSCATALEVSDGVPVTVGFIDGDYNNGCNWTDSASSAEWYTFTTSVDGIMTISSDLETNDPDIDDTRLSVFTGSCGDLTCVAADDDSGGEFLSSVTVVVSPGTTYYIQWDNRWVSEGFDFVVDESEVTCPDSSLPFSTDFSDAGQFYICWDQIDSDNDGQGWYVADYDFDDDGILDGNPSIASNSWNDVPLTPDNWAITYALDLSGLSSTDDILLRWSARGLDSEFPSENYSVYVSTGNEIADFLASSYSFTETLSASEGAGEFVDRSLDISELAGNTVYIAFRHHDVTDEFVLNIDNVSIDVTLGLDDLRSSNIVYTYNSERDELTLKSSENAFTSIELVNTLGQKVLNSQLNNTKETIQLNTLRDGIYYARIRRGEQMLSLNFLKH